MTRRRAALGLALPIILVILVSLVVGLRTSVPPAERTIIAGRVHVALAVDARTRRVFVANLGSATVSMLDADSGALLATVPVAPTPTRWLSPRPPGATLPSPTMSHGLVPAG